MPGIRTFLYRKNECEKYIHNETEVLTYYRKQPDTLHKPTKSNTKNRYTRISQDPIHFWGRQFDIYYVRFMDFMLHVCDNLSTRED